MKKAIILLIILWFTSNSAALGGLDNVAIHGFISQGYLGTTDYNYYFSDTKDGTFQFNDMGLNFGTDLSDSLRIGIQFFAKDLGITGNDEVTIDYAMADYNYRDWLGLRVGKIKKPNGLYNQTRDVDAGRLSIFLPQGVYGETYRDQALAIKGLCVYGRVFEQLDYQAYYGVFDVPLDSAFGHLMTSLMGAAPLSYDIDPTTGVFVLWNTPLQGLSLGSTYTVYKFAFDSANLGTLELSGYQAIGSVEFIYNNFTFSTEYSRNPTDTEISGFVISTDAESYYASAAYRLTHWFEFGGGYSASFSDIDDRDNPQNYIKYFFLSLRFDINDYWIFKLEGHSVNGLALIDPAELGPNPSEDWFMYAARLTFSF